MKKLFICVMTSLCSTFAFADADLVVKPATISNGNGTMQVVINKANTTAFQFDMKLPEGISVSAFGTASGDRKFENAQVDATTNTWRFLSYDEKNAPFATGTTLNVTLAAADDAEGGDAQTAGVLLVDPEGIGTDVDGGNVAVTVESNASITLNGKGEASFICKKDLNFSSLSNVKAYICTGIDVSANLIYFSRVKDVKANTPIYVTGPVNETVTVPTGNSITYYPENFLVGDATNNMTIPASTDEIQYWALSKNNGWIGAKPDMSLDAGKAYIKTPKQVANSSVSSENVEIKMSATGNLAYVGKYDLDFTSVAGLKAYVVIGFANDATIWISRVKTATAGTPLFLRGSNNQTYSVPSSSSSMIVKNMLRGDAENTSEVLKEYTKDGVDYVTWIYQKNGGTFGPLTSNQSAFPAGTAYLPLLKSYANKSASSRAMTSNFGNVVEETEVLVMKLGSLNGENDGSTSIRSIGEVQPDDAWYNLKGQRIDTPTKKGLYIKNGKKVVVK